MNAMLNDYLSSVNDGLPTGAVSKRRGPNEVGTRARPTDHFPVARPAFACATAVTAGPVSSSFGGVRRHSGRNLAKPRTHTVLFQAGTHGKLTRGAADPARAGNTESHSHRRREPAEQG